MMATVRCKFECIEAGQAKGWSAETQVVYCATLRPVMPGSRENESFYAATPAGELKISTAKVNAFEVGKEYYIDITPAEG